MRRSNIAGMLALVTLLVTACTPVLAANANANAQANDQDRGNSGNAGGQGNSNSNGQGNSGGADPTTIYIPVELPERPDQDAARDAVENGDAVSLEVLLSNAPLPDGSQLVEAQLVRVGGFLLYELRVLEADGQLHSLYYDATTGMPVELQP